MLFGYSAGRLSIELPLRNLLLSRRLSGLCCYNYGDGYSIHAHNRAQVFFALEDHEKSICYRSIHVVSKGDIPYYPIRLVNDKEQLAQYIDLAYLENNVTFVGRLATYRYLDMDVTIREALDVAQLFLHSKKNDSPMPSFLTNPL